MVPWGDRALALPGACDADIFSLGAMVSVY